ncbi:synergin gamma [Caerostris extrusa]|uniref:Synergin gamma n=1 Tax=Caerostris extrusa TaxID=172846 RepID=A0AAV4RXZ6_CAEEX|nr:synergin gamma [Caerostris extrusa]
MSPEEDKYSIFRTLQQVENTDDWGDFSSVATDLMSNVDTKLSDTEEFSQKSETISSELQANPSVFVTSNDSNLDLFKMENPAPIDTTKDDDDFGDFLHAEPPLPTVDAVTSQLKDLNTNFANFDNFKEPINSIEFHQMQLTGPSNNSQLDDEFEPICVQFGIGDLDGGGHSGESKSSLSRQGSIPSLDLKNTFVEGGEGEDYFGEFQSPVPPVNTSSKSPSPAKDVKGPENNGLCNNLLNVNFQNVRSVAPLTDKYSVIRAEERKDEDQHISCWVRCLQSSLNILQNTKKIFNQMSCSSVCNEVLRSEEGENYIKGNDQVWHTICGFFAGSALMPKESSLEFSSAILGRQHQSLWLVSFGH